MLKSGSRKLSVKGQVVNILRFASHASSIATTRLRLYNAKAALYKVQTNECVCGPIKLYL